MAERFLIRTIKRSIVFEQREIRDLWIDRGRKVNQPCR